MNKTSKIIAAFVVGAAAGSLLGMLLTPDKNRFACKNPCTGEGKKPEKGKDHARAETDKHQ